MSSNRCAKFAVVALAGLVAVTILGVVGVLPWPVMAGGSFVFAALVVGFSLRAAATSPARPASRETRLEHLATAAVVAAMASLATVAVMSGVVVKQERDLKEQEGELRELAAGVRANTERAEVAASRAVEAERNSRRRFVISTRRSRVNRRLARRAQRTATSTITVLRREGYPVPGTPGRPGARGAQGPGPTEVQVDAAVARCFAAGRCSPTPSAAQLAAAIRSYCEVGGACDPSPAQIMAAVVDVCGERKCRGPAGPQGPQGPQGLQGEPAPVVPSPMSPCPMLDPVLAYACVPVVAQDPPAEGKAR